MNLLPNVANPTVNETFARNQLARNQQTYQQLKLALGLNLRRQIFIAVCDDLPLRDRLADQLQVDLANPFADHSRRAQDDEATLNQRLVTLKIDLNNPNPIPQIARWLSQGSVLRHRQAVLPAFQIVGVEQLTRQPAAVQRSFWTYLQSIERSLPILDASLLFWMPQPWFRALPQSAPEFWHCRTAVFEFVGEPKPLSTSNLSATGAVAETRASSNALAERANSARAMVLASSNAPQKDYEDRKLQDFALDEQKNQPAVLEQLTSKTLQTAQALADLGEQYPTDLGQADLELVPPGEVLPSYNRAALGLAGTTDPLALLPRELMQWETDQLQELTVPIEAVGKPPKAAATSKVVQDLATLSEFALPEGRNAHNELEATAVFAQQSMPEEQEPTVLDMHQLRSHIEDLRQRGGSPEVVADAYCLLGEAYRDRIEAGDSSPETLRDAADTYEQVLRWLPQSSDRWSDVLNDLGNLYWMRSRQTSDSEDILTYLGQSVQAYQMALVRLNPEDEAVGYPMIQNNLGVTYADLARHHNLEDNLQRSIQAYREALRFRTPEADVLQYATTQNNLGTSYWTLAQHRHPQENLKQAIAAYTEALRYHTPGLNPLDYAMIQNNLGTAYWNLAQHEQPGEWLKQAIAAYEAALQYRTPEAAPAAFAATQNNLGTAYWHLATHSVEQPAQQAAYLQQAVQAYGAAIWAASTTNAAPLSFDVWATHNHLALAHYQLGTQSHLSTSRAEQSKHLEAALRYHLQALQNSAGQTELYQNAFNGIVQTIRAFHSQQGLEGQNWALSQVPPTLLTNLLPRL